jgi:hypothetical protein
LTADRRTAVSAFEAYEFHTTQQATNIRPGQTFGSDYSLTQVVSLDKDQQTLLQVGLHASTVQGQSLQISGTVTF